MIVFSDIGRPLFDLRSLFDEPTIPHAVGIVCVGFLCFVDDIVDLSEDGDLFVDHSFGFCDVPVAESLTFHIYRRAVGLAAIVSDDMRGDPGTMTDWDFSF